MLISVDEWLSVIWKFEKVQVHIDSICNAEKDKSRCKGWYERTDNHKQVLVANDIFID